MERHKADTAAGWRRVEGRDEPSGGAVCVVTETETVLRLARMCADDGGCALTRAPYTQCFCFELFRHAIARRDDRAWDALYARYGPLVRRWLGPAPDGDPDGEVAATFARFWHAVDAGQIDRFDSLAAVLQYLKACARTTRLDRARAGRGGGTGVVAVPLSETDPAAATGVDMADAVAGRVDAPGFWRAVRAHVAGEREAQVVHLSFVVGLSPREICARHGAQFPDVGEVYRLKRNLLDRLRRAPEMRAFLSPA